MALSSNFQARLLQLLIIVLVTTLLIWNYPTCPKLIPMVNNDCQLSLAESDGFICEWDTNWKERKSSYHMQDTRNMIKRLTAFFFFDNWSPNFHCSNAQRVGNMGEGGKWVCDLSRLKSRHDCLIYSVGSLGEYSFEIEMKKAMPHCEIHTFDKDFYPCPNDTCIFHTVKFGNGAPSTYSKDWNTILQDLNHTNRMIDILKMDIESDEYSFLSLMFNSTPHSFPKQILVELHPQNDNNIHEFFKQLRSNSYVIFSKEDNILAGPWYYEYSFLKLNPRFFIQS